MTPISALIAPWPWRICRIADGRPDDRVRRGMTVEASRRHCDHLPFDDGEVADRRGGRLRG